MKKEIWLEEMENSKSISSISGKIDPIFEEYETSWN